MKILLATIALTLLASCVPGVKYGVSYTHQDGVVSDTVKIERFTK